MWARWDSESYLSIARSGYFASGSLSNIAFFPLYPAIIKAVALLFAPWSRSTALYVAAGAIISNLVSMTRYCAIVFPVFLLLASIGKIAALNTFITFIFFAIQIIYMFAWVRFYWIA
jgi:hypothetical protein